MADETQDSKAQKLAAARKKLKEYQQRNINSNGGNNTYSDEPIGVSSNTTSSPASIASNLSERSDSELNLNGSQQQQQKLLLVSGETTPTTIAPAAATTTVLPTAASYFAQTELEHNTIDESAAISATTNLHAIQVLIAEKAQLTTELTKVRNVSHENELVVEELRSQQSQAKQQLEQLQQRMLDQQRSCDQQRNQNAELQHKLAQANAKIEDQQTHIVELETQIKLINERVSELSQQHAEKCNELDMALLRVRQLSDESNSQSDNRVDTLTQTQYMYEQQIRDLQAMVAQLTQDKEQASMQYQNYVQHQSGEIAKLNEYNAELKGECVQLQERERQLVEHVSGLERDIQKNLSLQAHFKETNKSDEKSQPEAVALSAELAQMKDRLSDFEFERHEFQLKIKSQHDQLQQLQQQLQEKDEVLVELENQLAILQGEQPDQVKLLATMESDKVAASRALTQNVEMKQQLDELEQRFVQLTNDKAELMNKLDAEEFANREMRHNYAVMEEKLHANEERFKFKDEEMIRLSHENEELSRNQLVLQQQLDRLQHYEAKMYSSSSNQLESEAATHESLIETETVTEATETCEAHNHDHDHDKHEHRHRHDSEHSHSYDHGHGHHNHHHHHDHDHDHSHDDSYKPLLKPQGDQYSHCTKAYTDQTKLPTTEALEKLQTRFTQLISKVADLTEEKYSLEHLVLQLQGETETIGEYIALYQTQRRMLKQREYEKATQMRLLQSEREQLRDKINMLNNLVASLGVELPQHKQLHEQLQAVATKAEAQETYAQSQAPEQPLNSNDSKQILNKIQNIITEIKENAEQPPTLPSVPPHSIDHFNCCMGKIDVV